MKREPRRSGRRLAVCLTGLALMIFALPGRALAPRAMNAPDEGITVHHRELASAHGSVYTTQVAEVRRALQPCLQARGNRPLDETLLETLSERYGERVQASTLASYIVLWRNGEWITICLGVATFEVDFEQHGTVVVEARSTMPMQY